jgi:hypothetical protein
VYDNTSVIPPGQKMQIDLEMQYSNLLHKMWFSEVPEVLRFKTSYTDDEKKLINGYLTFTAPDKKSYKIKDVKLEINSAKLHFIEFDLVESLPKTLTNHFLAPHIILNPLTGSTRQHINLFFPPAKNCTDIIVTFLRESDINHNLGPDIFHEAQSLPPSLQEMYITKTSGINNEHETLPEFNLQNLHINKMNVSWQNYINYLIDHEYLDRNSAKHFFKPNPGRMQVADSDCSTDRKPHNSKAYFPLAITSFIDQKQPLISIQTAQVNYSSMTLNLVFNAPPDNLNKYWCAIVYYNRYSLTFNLVHNEIKLSLA